MNKNLVYWVEVRQHNKIGELTTKEFVGEYKTHQEARAIIELAHQAEKPRKGLYSYRTVDLGKVKSRQKENKF